LLGVVIERMAPMKHSLRTKAAAAAAAGLILVGAIVAIATSGGGHATAAQQGSAGQAGGRGEMAVAASYLGITRSQLRSDLGSGRTLAQVANATSGRSAAGLIDVLVKARAAKLAAAVAAGHQSQAKANAALARFHGRVTAEVNRRGAASGLHAGGDLSAAASYLGLSRGQLSSQLASGRTLAAIAAATQGKSASGLIDALVSRLRAKLAAEVQAGTLTQAREAAVLPTLVQRVTAAVNRAPSSGSAEAARRNTATTGHGESHAPKSEEASPEASES